jgi:hypothetical protein
MNKDFIIAVSTLQEGGMLHLAEAVRDDLAAFAEGLDPLGISIKYNFESGLGGDYEMLFEVMKFHRAKNRAKNEEGESVSCRVCVPVPKTPYLQKIDMNLISNASTLVMNFLKTTLLTEEDLVKLEQNPESRWFIEYMNREMIPEIHASSSRSHSLL